MMCLPAGQKEVICLILMVQKVQTEKKQTQAT